MKKVLAAVAIAIIAGQALASCPVYAPYRCVPGPGGKQICGCGV